MKIEEILERFQPWRDLHRRDAWIPVTTDGDGPLAASKFAGKPWIGAGESWPKCGDCKKPMTFFLQLNLDDLPREFGRAAAHGLIQLFYCIECDGGWEPFSKTNLARLVPGPFDPASAGEEGPRSGLSPKSIVGWEQISDLPHPPEHDELGLIYQYDFKSKPVRTTIECPELGIRFENLEISDLAESLGVAAEGEKLGGWPCWVQGVEYPSCPKCSGRMELVFQVDSEKNLAFMFGDVGIGHITQCPKHPEVVAFGWACS